MPDGVTVTEYRASFDAAIRFSNGGDLTAHGFRVNVPSPDVDEAAIAALFVASLGLLMTGSVMLSNVEVFAEPHKGTRGGPSDRSPVVAAAGGRLVELSHVIRVGMITYPGLPGPEITPYLTREASRGRYAPGTEFAIDRLTLIGNTGTYLEAPYHRFPSGVSAGVGLDLRLNGVQRVSDQLRNLFLTVVSGSRPSSNPRDVSDRQPPENPYVARPGLRDEDGCKVPGSGYAERSGE